MRVRARANGNIVEMEETQARFFIEKGIYEAMDALPESVPDKPPADKPEPKPRKPKRKYKRRDMKAEE